MKPDLPNSPTAATLILALFTLAATARAGLEDQITRTYEVAPGGQLVVEVDRGSLEVRTADRGSVEIEVIRKARGGDARAAQVLKDHVVTTAQAGNRVEVRAEYNGPSSFGWFSRSPDLQVNYILTIPRKFEVNLKTAGGNIKVAELTGKTQVHTSGGNLTLEKIQGPLSGHTSGGNVSAVGCRGPVDLHTSGGNLNLSEIEGDVTAKTTGGSIHADKLTGKCIVKTSGGNIGVAGIKGSIAADTSGGRVNAEFIGPPSGDCIFKTSGGGITIALGERFAVDVDLHTSGGRVSTDFPVATAVQGEQNKNQLRGKVNGGGPLIAAHTSGGNVRLEKK
jgi:hypothetical protein